VKKNFLTNIGQLSRPNISAEMRLVAECFCRYVSPVVLVENPAAKTAWNSMPSQARDRKKEINNKEKKK